MTVSDTLNHIAPGSEGIDRIKDEGRRNPNRLQSIWFGFSLILVEAPRLIVMNLLITLWSLVTGIISSIVGFLAMTVTTLLWAITSLVLGFAGKLERRNGE